MQDHEVQPLLTIAEAMHFSANLKIGDEMTQPNKKKRVSYNYIVPIGIRY